MAIHRAEIRARWMTHGAVAAPASVVTGAFCSVGALTHWYVALETDEGWYGLEKNKQGTHIIRGRFSDSAQLDAAFCDGETKNISVKRTASRITKTLEEVLREFQGFSEYRLMFEAMNCKGFAEQVISFIESSGDSSRLLGLGPRHTPTNYLDMNIGKNECCSFESEVVSQVRHEYGGWFYKQRVYVTVKKSCNLAIRDESGDIYSLTCIRVGEHYVDYNSDRPNIVRVSW